MSPTSVQACKFRTLFLNIAMNTLHISAWNQKHLHYKWVRPKKRFHNLICVSHTVPPETNRQIMYSAPIWHRAYLWEREWHNGRGLFFSAYSMKHPDSVADVYEEKQLCGQDFVYIEMSIFRGRSFSEAWRQGNYNNSCGQESKQSADVDKKGNFFVYLAVQSQYG